MSEFQLVMPKMGESIAEATIIRWLKNEGERIEADEAVLEIATDKVDSEVPSTAAGGSKPWASTALTAVSIWSAAPGWFRLKRSIMAALRMVASGLATPLPAMSGALTWLGSYRP